MNFQIARLPDNLVLRALLASWLLLALSACNMPDDLPPLLASEQARSTRAAATVDSLMTAARASASSATVRQSNGASATIDIVGRTSEPSQNCQAQAAFVDDVTIRDGTLMEPGAAFVKVWRLRNTGDCIWSPDYSLVFFGGSRLGAPEAAPLSARVSPDQTVDIALEMAAPREPGTYQGYWKLQTPSGRYFGIGPSADQSFWVKIEVANLPTETGSAPPPASPTATATPSFSATPAATQSATPTPYVEGTATLEVDQSFDLDSGTIVTTNQADVQLALATAGSVSLNPVHGARIGEHSPIQQEPERGDCSIALLSTASIALSELASGDHICYQTGSGRFGFIRVDALAPVFGFAFRTYGP